MRHNEATLASPSPPGSPHTEELQRTNSDCHIYEYIQRYLGSEEMLASTRLNIPNVHHRGLESSRRARQARYHSQRKGCA